MAFPSGMVLSQMGDALCGPMLCCFIFQGTGAGWQGLGTEACEERMRLLLPLSHLLYPPQPPVSHFGLPFPQSHAGITRSLHPHLCTRMRWLPYHLCAEYHLDPGSVSSPDSISQSPVNVLPPASLPAPHQGWPSFVRRERWAHIPLFLWQIT